MYVQRTTQSRRSEIWVLVNVNIAYMHPSSVCVCMPADNQGWPHVRFELSLIDIPACDALTAVMRLFSLSMSLFGFGTNRSRLELSLSLQFGVVQPTCIAKSPGPIRPASPFRSVNPVTAMASSWRCSTLYLVSYTLISS
jgi:hypothetical protein